MPSEHSSAIWAAIIASVGVVAAAWIGVSCGRARGTESLVDLQSKLDEREAELNKRASEINKLRNALADASAKCKPLPCEPGSSRSASANRSDPRGASTKPATHDAGFTGLPTDSESISGVGFDLYGCTGQTGTIVCELAMQNIVSLSKQVMISVQQRGGIRATSVGFTSATDKAGTQFVASSVLCGNVENPETGQLWCQSERSRKKIVLTFAGAKPTSTVWTLRLSGMMDRPFTLVFDDVPLQMYRPDTVAQKNAR